jgi:hypothetical protein
MCLSQEFIVGSDLQEYPKPVKQRNAFFKSIQALFTGAALAGLLLLFLNAAVGRSILPATGAKSGPDSNPFFGPAEACALLGFRYDAEAPAPLPKCAPQKSCYAGGAFVLTYGSLSCRQLNPATNSCSCPSGFADLAVGSVNIRNLSCGKDCSITVADTVHHCQYCPQ